MEEYLRYELAKQPPSLFDKGIMRKGNKCTLGTILKSNATILTEPPDEARFVLDGGHLIHIVPWPSDGTYHDVCLAYVSYIEEHYDHHVTVVFDGYDSSNSTKGVEQRRLAAQATSGDILFELDMKANTPTAKTNPDWYQGWWLSSTRWESAVSNTKQMLTIWLCPLP